MGSVAGHLPCFWTGSPTAALRLSAPVKKISRPLSRLQKQATSWTTSSIVKGLDLQGEVDDVAEPRARSGLRVPSVGPPLVFLREVQIFSTFFFDLAHLGPSFSTCDPTRLPVRAGMFGGSGSAVL